MLQETVNSIPISGLRIRSRSLIVEALVAVCCLSLHGAALASEPLLPTSTDSTRAAAEVAVKVDQAVTNELSLQERAVTTFTPADEDAFLRRLYFDLVGRPPQPSEITRYGLDTSPNKEDQLIQQLLASDDYAQNFTYYWRDSMFRRATNARANIAQAPFEEWMRQNLSENRSWSEIATGLLTSTGSVNDNGATALLFAHEGEAAEIAAEASRLFLGIQIQCANCHDHPWDRWKREQFHELVAFFPRVSVRRQRDTAKQGDYEVVSVNADREQRRRLSEFYLRRVDRNNDGVVTKQEAEKSPFQRLFEGQLLSVIDKNSDGQLSLEEIKSSTPDANRPGQGALEHYMEFLNQPGERGQLMKPVFFLTGTEIQESPRERRFGRASLNRSQGISDLERRTQLAELLTSNRWFAVSVVNRYWATLTGVPFYSPVDDIGPDRSAEHEAALNVLTDGFVASGYDLKWLLTTIVKTEVYRRQVNPEAEGFVRREPQRLRSDQLYSAICQVLNINDLPMGFTAGRSGPNFRTLSPGRRQFMAVFGFDPEKTQDELVGSIPESLLLMNAEEIQRVVEARRPDSMLSRVANSVLSDEDVVREIYLTMVSREPDTAELQRCLQHLAQTDSQREALEDVVWALMNSLEFQTRP